MTGHSVPQAVDLLGFLTLGLLGGFGHCVGMCSPFVLFVSRRYAVGAARVPAPGGAGAPSGGSSFVPQLWYAAGRILTYAALGAVAGVFGGAVQKAGAFMGVQRAAMILAGGVLVLWALTALADLARFDAGGRLFAKVAGAVKGRVPGHPFALGLFLGLLPCGFLYSAVVAAVSRGSALQGALAMAVFGFATAPALLAVSIADDLLGIRRRVLFNRLSQAFILVMGAMFLWRGLVR